MARRSLTDRIGGGIGQRGTMSRRRSGRAETSPTVRVRPQAREGRMRLRVQVEQTRWVARTRLGAKNFLTRSQNYRYRPSEYRLVRQLARGTTHPSRMTWRRPREQSEVRVAPPRAMTKWESSWWWPRKVATRAETVILRERASVDGQSVASPLMPRHGRRGKVG